MDWQSHNEGRLEGERNGFVRGFIVGALAMFFVCLIVHFLRG